MNKEIIEGTDDKNRRKGKGLGPKTLLEFPSRKSEKVEVKITRCFTGERERENVRKLCNQRKQKAKARKIHKVRQTQAKCLAQQTD